MTVLVFLRFRMLNLLHTNIKLTDQFISTLERQNDHVCTLTKTLHLDTECQDDYP